MTDEINLHDTMDAEIWAREFCRIVGEKIPEVREHEDWMLGWFANAIMAGHDGARREIEKEMIDVVEVAMQDAEAERSG